jgi:hypothetical protein
MHSEIFEAVGLGEDGQDRFTGGQVDGDGGLGVVPEALEESYKRVRERKRERRREGEMEKRDRREGEWGRREERGDH